MRYSQKKFQSQSLAKKKKIIYQTLRKIEISLNIEDFILLKDYINFFDENEMDESLSKLSSLKNCQNIPDKHTLAQCIVPLERELKSVRDSDFIIEEGDKIRHKENLPERYVFLHNLRSTFNIGSIFRIAESFGFHKIYLSGYSATPENDKLKKSAMGTESKIEWEYISDFSEKINEIKAKGIKIVALETVKDADFIYESKLDDSFAVILGNEALGIEKKVLQLADLIVKIPSFGWKNSLNVGVAFAVFAYEAVRQIKKRG